MSASVTLSDGFVGRDVAYRDGPAGLLGSARGELLLQHDGAQAWSPRARPRSAEPPGDAPDHEDHPRPETTSHRHAENPPQGVVTAAPMITDVWLVGWVRPYACCTLAGSHVAAMDTGGSLGMKTVVALPRAGRRRRGGRRA